MFKKSVKQLGWVLIVACWRLCMQIYVSCDFDLAVLCSFVQRLPATKRTRKNVRCKVSMLAEVEI